MFIQMALSRVIIQENSDTQFIFLKEVSGKRSFPIVIGTQEAVAIDYRLKGLTFPRPMTHDLIFNVIKGCGADLEKILITELKEHTFYANLVLRRGEEIIAVDSRPSDAIALAVVNETPIFVSEKVLEAACDDEEE